MAYIRPKSKIEIKIKASNIANKPKEFIETAKGYKNIVSISKIKNKIA